jgi:pimeloyl-ACP methyl ester carboxylesterase
LGIASRYPGKVRKLAIAGSHFSLEGYYPEIVDFMRKATPADMEMMRPNYESLAPNPADWPVIVDKIMALGTEFSGWTRQELQQIQAPTLIVIGDADVVKPEHAVEMFRLIPHANLAVLPVTDHFMRLQDPQWLLSMLQEFFSAPVPEAQQS